MRYPTSTVLPAVILWTVCGTSLALADHSNDAASPDDRALNQIVVTAQRLTAAA
jgi:hypothetical protein